MPKRKNSGIKVDIRKFSQFEKKLEKLKDESLDEFIKSGARVLAGAFLERVKKRTPVGKYGDRVEFTTRAGEFVSFEAATHPTVGGTLRNGWQLVSLQKTSQGYSVEISNNVSYASFVENGHVIRNKKGGPAKGWVNGRFMLRDTEMEMVFITPEILEKKLERFLRNELSGK